MSAAPSAASKRAVDASREAPPSKGLRGLMPYLRRYTGGIVFGLLTVVLMGVVGYILPLATVAMTGTLAVNAVPFVHSVMVVAPLVMVMVASKLGSLILF